MRFLLAIFFLVAFSVTVSSARAGVLVSVSDLISASAPSATSTHILTFTLSSALPPSGTIAIVPQAGAYSVQSGFNYTDVDFEVASSSSFAHRTLAASANTVDDGIALSGAAITITLNSLTGLSAGETVRVTLGGAAYGATGDRFPVNAASVGSYRIAITTADGSGVLDSGTAMIALVQPVAVTVEQAPQPPTRANGLPSGTVAAGNGSIELSFETNEEATCRYATTTGVLYEDMINSFSSANAGMLFYTTVTGHTNNTTYNYYVRCIDTEGSANTDDYAITFTLDVDPVSDTSIDTGSGSGSSSSSGDFPGGSNTLYLADFDFSGLAPAGSTVTILKDGVIAGTVLSDTAGLFKTTINRLERGVYTFGAYARDSGGRMTTSYTTTLMLEGGTDNKISDILLSPTLASVIPNPSLGENLSLIGETVPGSTVRLIVSQKVASLLSQVSATSASSTDGVWRETVPGTRITKGSFVIQARAEMEDRVSHLSPPLVLGLGGEGATKSGSPDINGDGKVNLTDFSIMLSSWLTSDSGSDFNTDGTVNLADFSILLFNWTG